MANWLDAVDELLQVFILVVCPLLLGPVVELVQPGAEQEDEVAEEIAREQEGGPGLRTIEPGVAIPQHGRTHLAHQQIGEERAWQQDGEEVHQADEELLGVKVHRFLRHCSAVMPCCLSLLIFVVCPQLLHYGLRFCQARVFGST